MTDNQTSHIQNLLSVHRSNLRRLEKQIAQHGGEMAAPIHLLNQRDETMAEIERLENRLKPSGQHVAQVESQAAPEPAHPAGKAPAQTDLVSLYQKLDENFSKEELKMLCFRLDIDYESLGGEGKAAKARELVLYCKRHGLVASLVQTCVQLRPHISW